MDFVALFFFRLTIAKRNINGATDGVIMAIIITSHIKNSNKKSVVVQSGVIGIAKNKAFMFIGYIWR